MNKEVIEEKAMLYALGTMPRSEVKEFEEQIRNDSGIQDLVHQSQLINELDAKESPPVDVPFQTYSKTMTKIDQLRRIAPPPAGEEPRRGVLVSVLAWSGWAAAACLGVVAGMGVFSEKDLSSESDIVLNNLASPRLVAVEEPAPDFTMEDRMAELAALTEAYWYSREANASEQFLVGSGAEVEELSGGFTIFDKKYNIGFIAVENMPSEQAGKSYHVWAKTDGGSHVVRAGALPIGDESEGLFFIDLSTLPTSISLDQVSFFVTEESIDEPERPTGMVVLSDF